MKKRILAVVLALALCVGLVPTTAFAADMTVAPGMTEITLTNAEMIAKLPSQAPEVIKPETVDQLKYWGTGDWTGKESNAEAIFQEIIELTESLTNEAETDTETEKVSAIFGWVAYNISYAYDAFGAPDHDGFTGTALGAFYYRRGVCAGYAKLANLMLALAGIPTAYILGLSKNRGDHGWSAAYADGQWILFDATWDEWDISPDFHKKIESIEYTSGDFLITLSRAGESALSIMPGYNCPSEVIIPDGVTSIKKQAFYECGNLTSVTIGNSVTSIDNWAFSGCTSLTSVTIPNGVTSIGSDAFAFCASLTSVTIPNSVTSIGTSAFYGCTSLTSVAIPSSVASIGDWAFSNCTGLTSVTIGDGVTNLGWSHWTTIGEQAFQGCTVLTSVTIPASATDIGCYAFNFCYNLTDVYYAGTESQWNEIAIDDGNHQLAGATIHYHSHPTVMKFPDLSPSGYYLDAVQWAVANNITTGKTTTTFAPNENCTHAQILTFLWRAAGEPASNVALPFSTTGKEYYLGAAKWAYEKGMIGADFNPSAPCNRAYAVLYIWQAFGKPAPSKASPFTDVPAHWSSATAAAWAAEKGITTGTTATTFDPGGICNRAQIVTFLYRAYK